MKQGHADDKKGETEERRCEMEKVCITDERMHPDGSRKAGGSGQQQNLPETAAGPPAPCQEQDDYTARSHAPAKSRTIMRNQWHEVRIPRIRPETFTFARPARCPALSRARGRPTARVSHQASSSRPGAVTSKPPPARSRVRAAASRRVRAPPGLSPRDARPSRTPYSDGAPADRGAIPPV